MPTSLVTGGAGFLGSHLCEALIGRGHRVICVDNLDTSTLENAEHLRDDAVGFVNHVVTSHIEGEEPLDYRRRRRSSATPPHCRRPSPPRSGAT